MKRAASRKQIPISNMKLIIAMFALAFAALSAPRAEAAVFGEGDYFRTLRKLAISAQQIEEYELPAEWATARNGDKTVLASHSRLFFVFLGVNVTDEGYVIQAAGDDIYWPLTPDWIKELQAGGILPDPMPKYSTPLIDLLLGYSLWIIIGCLVLFYGTKALLFRKKPAEQPPATEPPAAAEAEGIFPVLLRLLGKPAEQPPATEPPAAAEAEGIFPVLLRLFELPTPADFKAWKAANKEARFKVALIGAGLLWGGLLLVTVIIVYDNWQEGRMLAEAEAAEQAKAKAAEQRAMAEATAQAEAKKRERQRLAAEAEAKAEAEAEQKERERQRLAAEAEAKAKDLLNKRLEWTGSAMRRAGVVEDKIKLALTQGGTVLAWPTAAPAGLSGVVAIAAGNEHTVALRQDGTVVAWGSDRDFDAKVIGQSTVPASLSGVVAITAGAYHTMALRQDGTVVAWGRNNENQTAVPGGLIGVVAIAANNHHSLALRQNGTVMAWGLNGTGQTDVPAGLSGVVAIAAGAAHSLALRQDGKVAAWGWNQYGQTDVPAGISGVVAIAAGLSHSLALRQDGTVVGWGETSLPTGLRGVVAIAASVSHTVVLKLD